jgi:hypothetical protein
MVESHLSIYTETRKELKRNTGERRKVDEGTKGIKGMN